MIGWINNSVEAFLRDTFGDHKWVEILEESGVKDSYPWVSSCPFTDKITYDLVITGARVLGVTVDQALEAYGTYFVKYATDQGYSKLLKTLGGDIIEFLENLNYLHLHLTLDKPEMQAPSFRSENVTPESVELHYYSNRPGLWPIVVGILKGLSEEFFKLKLSVELLKARHSGHDHEVFLVKFPRQSTVHNRMHQTPIQTNVSGGGFGLSPEQFADLYPFHIMMDKNFSVMQCGRVIQRLLPGLGTGGHVAEHIQIKMPRIKYVWKEVVRESNAPFLLRLKSSGLELKGHMLITSLPIPNCPAREDIVIFLGSPRCANLEDLQRCKIFLSDIPIHDISGDFVMLAEQRQAEAMLKEKLEIMSHELRAEKARSDALVQRMSALLACFPTKKDRTSVDISVSGLDLRPAIRGPLRKGPSNLSINSSLGGANEAVRHAMHMMSKKGADENIELIKPIGEGSFGKVYRGTWQGTEVAVKTIVLPAKMGGSSKREKMAIMEAAISSSLNHPNVVKTYTYSIKPMRDSAPAGLSGANTHTSGGAKTGGALSTLGCSKLGLPSNANGDGESLKMDGGMIVGGATENEADFDCGSTSTSAISAGTADNGTSDSMVKRLEGGTIHSYEIQLVMEFCDKGSLRDTLDAHMFRKPSDGETNFCAVLDTALEISRAMLHLHKQNVLHADIKARNILLQSSGANGKGFIAKVADFGLSRKMDSEESHASDMFQGTLTHMAPEIMMEGQISKSADVYAFGILLWELYSGGHPFQGTPKALLGHMITTMDKRPEFPADTPSEFKRLAQWCWAGDPKLRPIFEEVLLTLNQMRSKEEKITPSVFPPALFEDSLSTLHSPGQEEKWVKLPSGLHPPQGLEGSSGKSFFPSLDESMDYGSAILGEDPGTQM